MKKNSKVQLRRRAKAAEQKFKQKKSHFITKQDFGFTGYSVYMYMLTNGYFILSIFGLWYLALFGTFFIWTLEFFFIWCFLLFGTSFLFELFLI
jgi:hypothetical protein